MRTVATGLLGCILLIVCFGSTTPCNAQSKLLPDLVIDDFWESKHSVFFTIANQGLVTAKAGHVAYLHLNGQHQDSRTITSDIKPGKSLSTSFPKFYWNCTQDGNYQLSVIADATGKISETNEKNNSLTETWTCTTPKADLIIDTLSLKGQTIQCTIKNQGTASASSGHFAILRVDGSYKDGKVISQVLAPNASVQVSFTGYTWECTDGKDIVEVEADTKNTVNESDENNNSLSDVWTCEVAPPHNS